MAMPARRRWVLLICVMCTFVTPARAGEAESWDRLRAMPRERRLALSANIKQFDALPGDERAAIREIDERIAKLPPAEQARYRDVLRRYHVWVQGLSDEQRALVAAGKSEKDRMSAVSKLRKAGASALARRDATPLSVKVAPLMLAPPAELGRLIRAWIELGPVQRTNFDKLGPGQFITKMEFVANKKAIPRSPTADLSNEEQQKLIKELETELGKVRQAPVALKLQLEKAARADPDKDVAKAARNYREHLVENYYYLKHPPEKVKTENLLRFNQSLPGWVRSALTSLPADEAKRRLAILYRLVYPAPEEIPIPKAPEKAATAKPGSKPAPAAKDSAKPTKKAGAPQPKGAESPF